MTRTLHGLGAGPGDPELITVLAARLLHDADVVFLPSTREGTSFARSIVKRYLTDGKQRVVELVGPPFRSRTAVEFRWEELAEVVAECLEEGSAGVFVCEGDPSLYGTFLHLRRALERHHPEITVRTVPGVTSVSASAALANMPLASWDERLLIAPAVYDLDGLEALLSVASTVALLKAGRDLAPLLDAIDALGPAVEAALVRRAGRPEQQVLRDTSAMRAAANDYFTTLLIRKTSA